MHDLAIVGAGQAGVATAYFLRGLNRDVTILEAADEVGGRDAQCPRGRSPVQHRSAVCVPGHAG
jgi:cation diffusion facilitator CzcD-associated flavoprotein CzcO